MIVIGVAVWVLAPIFILIGLVAWLEWRDERQWRRDEQSMRVWIAMEEAWLLPPNERHRS